MWHWHFPFPSFGGRGRNGSPPFVSRLHVAPVLIQYASGKPSSSSDQRLVVITHTRFIIISEERFFLLPEHFYLRLLMPTKQKPGHMMQDIVRIMMVLFSLTPDRPKE
ncbi:hypothetical protein ASPBRDRAFT_284530 [Aspergillus brasiliensis CBS 101740]|uniref:Uncharacterized protein n=1 Tax=Aspergillus brasiliensis (strain CBS 101740 / IMI 381727 / IBT 21946) TaxID=767769 RepID=A0A1L9UDB2_ASPBC|nr:hypothetical protein ASPBRDRAFT_284530 [Aspergillus brasiliensis CBS 101740]